MGYSVFCIFYMIAYFLCNPVFSVTFWSRFGHGNMAHSTTIRML